MFSIAPSHFISFSSQDIIFVNVSYRSLVTTTETKALMSKPERGQSNENRKTVQCNKQLESEPSKNLTIIINVRWVFSKYRHFAWWKRDVHLQVLGIHPPRVVIRIVS
jgi:hypothetical protein